jgi:hypothetical protein
LMMVDETTSVRTVFNGGGRWIFRFRYQKVSYLDRMSLCWKMHKVFTLFLTLICNKTKLTLEMFFSTGFYSPYRTLAFLNGLLDPQTFGRTPWLGDQSNARHLPTHRTTQHRNTQTHIHAPSRIRTWDLNVQAVEDSTCLDRSAIETGTLEVLVVNIFRSQE